MTDDDKLKHDFINNCIRIEVLQKLINESIDSKSAPDPKYLQDLTTFYREQIEFIKAL